MREYANSTTSPCRIRERNTVAALQALFDHGSPGRADLARIIGLNRSSSGGIIAELVASSLVREVDEEDARSNPLTRSGHPGILLELDPQAAFFLGAEIGVEHITTAQMAAEAGAGYGAACMLHRRFISLEDGQPAATVAASL